MSEPQLMVVYDAPVNLRRAFFENGFRRYGPRGSSWCRDIDRDSDEARDLEYELQGVGLTVVWRQSKPRAAHTHARHTRARDPNETPATQREPHET